MQLTIDTSSQKVGIALSLNDSIIGANSWYSQENHTRELTPGIKKLLEQNETNMNDIDCIYVARGPGSFNGLRVGMSFAKGLALALKVPLIGISTLTAEAYLHAGQESPVCPLHEAGRGEVAAALYQRVNGVWRILKEEHITTVDCLFTETSGETVFCGEITEKLTTELRKIFGQAIYIAPLPESICRAVLIARLGWQRMTRKDYDNIITLQPLYLRRPPITRPRADRHFIIKTPTAEEY